jgi:hypothetical protein
MLQRIVKVCLAAFYAIGGPVIHIILMTTHREVYAAIDDYALPFYQFLWNTFVLPNLVPLAILLIAFEFAAGLLMFSRTPLWAEIGQLAGLVFNLLLIPFWFFYAIPNLVLAALHAWLLYAQRHSHPTGNLPAPTMA